MSIDLFVQRGSGNRRGDDIVDPLIGSIPVAIQRGRNELDERASGTQPVEVETVYRDGVRPGQTGKFFDASEGALWVGKIAGVTHSFSNGQLTTRLHIKKPTNFFLG